MERPQIGMTRTLLSGVLALSVLASTMAWGQTSPTLPQVEEQLQEKYRVAAAHQQQMQGIKDPAQLSVEMRRHFRMTEEILALMLERRKLAAPAAIDSTPVRGAPGGHRGGHAGLEPGSGMAGSTPGQAAKPQERGVPGGPLRQHGKAPGQSSDVSASQTPESQVSGPERGVPGGYRQQHAPYHTQHNVEVMEQMLQEITAHSAYLDTLQDQMVLGQKCAVINRCSTKCLSGCSNKGALPVTHTSRHIALPSAILAGKSYGTWTTWGIPPGQPTIFASFGV